MHIVIIGNGIAGITAARYIRKLSDHDVTVVSAESDHFYSRTALMYVYMGHMTYDDIKPYEDFFWEKNRINLMRAYALSVDCEKKTIRLSTGQILAYDKLVLATGSKSNKMEWPGRNLRGVQGLYGLPDLALMEQSTRGIERAVVVGGGLLGIEMCEMLRSRHVPVTLMVREAGCWQDALPREESEMVDRHVREHGVDLLTNTQLKRIIDDGNGRVRAIETTDGQVIECQWVGLAVGVHPNLDLVRSSPPIEFKAGILVNRYLETNVPDVYAIGDCAQQKHQLPGRKRIEQVWYTGKIMGATVAKTICGSPTMYEPGPWYNSAKFFDIEYSTYGAVPGETAKAEDSPPSKERDTGVVSSPPSKGGDTGVVSSPPSKGGDTGVVNSLYWEHPTGRKSIRIVYDTAQGNKVIGFNLMGVRFRHYVCERWLTESRDLEYVLTHLKAVRFDSEMGDRYEKEVLRAYERESGKRLRLKPARGLGALIHRN